MSGLISIAIPSLNQGQFLQDAINSLLNQKGVNLKIALVDGRSTDQTSEVLAPYRDKLNYLRSFPDNGQAAAINEGISRLERSTYVGWLNADDVLLPDGLREMASFLDHHSECVAVFGMAHVIDEKGRIVGEYRTKPFDQKSFAVNCTICQPASLIRRSAWDSVGGLNESIQTCMDYDLWWRLSQIGPIGYLEEFVACTRDHPRSKTRTQRKIVNLEATAILLRHWGMVPRNWCTANVLENLEPGRFLAHGTQRWEATKLYFQINKWKGLLPQNWLLWKRK